MLFVVTLLGSSEQRSWLVGYWCSTQFYFRFIRYMSICRWYSWNCTSCTKNYIAEI